MRILAVCVCAILLGGACSEEGDQGSGGSGPAGAQGSGAGATTGTTTTGTGGAGATTTGTGGMGGAGGGACTPKTNDASGVGLACAKDTDCPMAYVCQEYVGFVVTYSCEVPCSQTCDCPTGLSCVQVMDKMNTWMQCAP